jgi:hypothetical protein
MATQAPASSVGPSPLTALFLQRARTEGDASRLSQQLLDAALAIQQEATSLADLLQRFPADRRLSAPAQAALDRLLTEHFTAFDNALNAEEQLVLSLQAPGGPSPAASVPVEMAQQTLIAAAKRDRALCSELISGSDPSPRPAEAIAADIRGTIESLRLISENERTAAPSTPTRGPSP